MDTNDLSFRDILRESELTIDDVFVDRLISLLAGAQVYRKENHSDYNPSVTRSILLVALNEFDEKVSQILSQTGLDWHKFLQDTGLEGSISELEAKDVAITYEFRQTLKQLGESIPKDVQISAYTLALHLLKLAISDSTGSLRERLKKSGAKFDQLQIAVDKALTGQPDERPTVWLLQYKDEDEWTPTVAEGDKNTTVSWLSSKRIKGIKPGDPVLYWRTISKRTKDRGGLVGTGRFLPEAAKQGSSAAGEQAHQKTVTAKTGYYYPTQIVEWFPDDLIPRDELIEKTRLKMSWGLGSIQAVPEKMSGKINAYLIDDYREPLFPAKKGPVVFVDDSPTLTVDHLQRSDIAFILAARLNRIWIENNKTGAVPGNEQKSEESATQRKKGYLGKISGYLRKRFPCWFSPMFHPNQESSFVVHVDAPWGGGKTSFANYLQAILNPAVLAEESPDWYSRLRRNEPGTWPQEFRRYWHVVSFNAWLHQHLDPPWWCFYQAIRRQCFRAVLKGSGDNGSATAGDGKARTNSTKTSHFGEWVKLRSVSTLVRNRGRWLMLWLSELIWRLSTPKVVLLCLTLLLTVGVSIWLSQLGYFKLSSLANLFQDIQEGAQGKHSPVIETALVVLFGGATAVWTVIAAFTDTLLPGTPNAAKNYSLGFGDPFDRFRRHFSRILCMLQRPVLVVIDDLDRCEPEFVVEMMCGIQNILRSSRVVFVILGDRNWIEHSFSIVHKDMRGIQVGPEHTFGGRFVEKVIQLSLVLPGLNPDARKSYVTKILDSRSAEMPVPDRKGGTSPVKKLSAQGAGGGGTDKTQKPEAETEEKKRERATKRAFASAVDPKTEQETRHRLLPVAPVLPGNPRQIKRIINAISFYQEIALIRHFWGYDSANWCNLALWVVIMTEWPKSWAMLSAEPDLVGRVRKARATRNSPGPDGEETVRQPNDPAEQEKALSDQLPTNDSDLTEGKAAQRRFALIMNNEELWRILDFTAKEGSWLKDPIDGRVIEKLNEIMPLSGGTSPSQ